MIVYATKYAMTRGIERLEINPAHINHRYIYYGGRTYPNSSIFTDSEEAMAHAEDMREKKIAKLRALKITVVDG